MLIRSLCKGDDDDVQIVENTRRNVVRKQVQTVEERDQEAREEEEGVLPDLVEPEVCVCDSHHVMASINVQADDSDDEVVQNPLNLPLGWDGKPIPYWMYKLYGMNEEFVCEICGNYTYCGRRAFDQHFQEWRHAYGMRCLKIPNTKHFHDITLIEDAISCKYHL